MDGIRELEVSGERCSPEILELVERSRQKLQKADSYVHKAVKRRKEGNLLSARANLDRALEIYPKYYWVQTLKKNIDRSIKAELDSLKNEATYFESRNDPEGALSRIRDAMKLSPGDAWLESEEIRLQKAVVEKTARQGVQDRLDRASVHLEAGRYEEARLILTEGDAPMQLGTRGEAMLVEVDRQRQEQVGRRFSVAVEREKAGDLTAAALHTLYVLNLSRPSDEASEKVVNFARLLGMKFYSTGELSRAKKLWTGALDLDPENQKLRSYLKEVDTRLDSLDRIKKEGADGEGN